jgi:hypothetical protein
MTIAEPTSHHKRKIIRSVHATSVSALCVSLPPPLTSTWRFPTHESVAVTSEIVGRQCVEIAKILVLERRSSKRMVHEAQGLFQHPIAVMHLVSIDQFPHLVETQPMMASKVLQGCAKDCFFTRLHVDQSGHEPFTVSLRSWVTRTPAP